MAQACRIDGVQSDSRVTLFAVIEATCSNVNLRLSDA